MPVINTQKTKKEYPSFKKQLATPSLLKIIVLPRKTSQVL
jgi:hypothetical protein